MEKLKGIHPALYRKIGIESGKSMEDHRKLVDIICLQRWRIEGEAEDALNITSYDSEPTKEDYEASQKINDNLAILKGMDAVLDRELPKYKSYNYSKVILQ